MSQRRTRASRMSVLALGLAVAGVAACSSSGSSTSTGTSTGTSAASGAATGSGSSGSASSSTPFDVVIDTGVTGAYGANGTAAADGVKAAAAVLNASGGILGHQVKVEVLDNQGNPNTAASLLEQRLSSGTKPDMIEPGSISTEGVVEVPIASAAKILSIGTPNDSSLNDPSKYPDEFLMSPPASLAQEGLMSYFKAHHDTTVGMIYSTDAYGASVEQATATAAQQAGITLTTASYNDTDLNVTAQLQKLQAAHPQVLYIQSFGSPAGVILQDQYALGWKVTTIGDLTTATTPLVGQDASKPAEKGLLLQNLPIDQYSSTQSAAITNFISAIKKFGPIVSPLTTVSFQYDSLMLVAQAAKQANSIATPALASALENLKQPSDPQWVTLTSFAFSAASHAPDASPSNWIVSKASSLVDGQYDAPGSGS